MDLSVIIVNWNTREMLRQCLDSLIRNLTGLNHEVFVVDNGSTDGSPEMVAQQFPDVHLIVNKENVGFSRANNQAILRSSGKYILLLNSDAFVQDDSIQKMCSILDDNPQIGIAGANLIYPDGSPQVSHGPLPTLMIESLRLFGLDKLLSSQREDHLTGKYVETGTVEGACLLVRRKTINEIGMMDEDFFFFNEEVDLCYRAHLHGWKVVYIPDTRIVHIRGGSTGIVPHRVLLLYRGKLQYFEKHFGQKTRAKLYRMIILATKIKIIVYGFLRLITLGQMKQDILWKEVFRELSTLSGKQYPR